MVAEAAELPRSVELNGKVVMDPNAGGKVQPLNAGRIEPGPRGLPNPGQAVRKGEVLAYVVPSAAPIERSNQSAQLAELRAAKSLADKRVARLKELSDTVPRKDIEAAESEAASLAERIAAVGGGLATREALVAPVSGVIASANVVAGQVVDARELLFEVVDPGACASRRWPSTRRWRPTSAAPRWPSATSACRWCSSAPHAACASRRCRWAFGRRAQHSTAWPSASRCACSCRRKQKVKGIAVPVASLMKNPANQTVVWVKTAPERFEPRAVTTEPLDGVNVAVTSGLKAGDRVATQGATLINQVALTMFKWLLDNSLTNRLLVIIASVVLMAYGAFTLSRTPVDVFPDLNKPTVTIMTEAGGMAAEEVEQLITFPLETTMNGLPGVESGALHLVGRPVLPLRHLRLEHRHLPRPAAGRPSGCRRWRKASPKASCRAWGRSARSWARSCRSPFRSIRSKISADGRARVRRLGAAAAAAVGARRRAGDPDRRRRCGSSRCSPTPRAWLNWASRTTSSRPRSRVTPANTSGGFLELNGREYLIRNLGRTSRLDDLKNLALTAKNGQPILLRPDRRCDLRRGHQARRRGLRRQAGRHPGHPEAADRRHHRADHVRSRRRWSG
jgi:hypothetical protein